MIYRRRSTLLVLFTLVGWLFIATSNSYGQVGPEKDRKNTIAAISYLGEVDCEAFPESQEVLADNVENHEFEDVRFAAAKALFKQLQRGRRPLNPLNGWREIPDPFILEQVLLLATFREPWTMQELTEKYADRKVEKEQAKASKNGRKDLLKGCVSDETIKTLARVAYNKDEFGCWVEPSERVRKEAENGLLVALGVETAEQRLAEILAKPATPADPMTPVPDESQQTTEVDTSQLQLLSESASGRGRGPIGAQIGFQGRADTANRFNLIDGIGAAPRNRAWAGYQFVAAQNKAINVSTDVNRIFSEFNNLGTIQSREEFIQQTGFGLGRTPGFDPVDPFDAESNRQLRNEFFTANTGGKTERFLASDDTNLYRFGFEYTVTPDFSIGMQGQYVAPVDDSGQQPDVFSNPLILMKHVAYRDDKQLAALLLGISPQISQSEISIVERTTRISPGLLYFRESERDDRWFMQAGTAFSLPTDSDKIVGWDWALGVGYWLYRHESLLDPNLVDNDAWLLGIVPQFEVLGKHVIGDNQVTGAFGLSGAAPKAAAGTTSSRTDAAGTLLFEDGSALSAGTFIFDEPRHVVDLTAAAAFILRNNWTFSMGYSFPVTGGSARAGEFLTTIQYGF